MSDDHMDFVMSQTAENSDTESNNESQDNFEPFEFSEQHNESLDLIDSYNQSNYDRQMNTFVNGSKNTSNVVMNSNFYPEKDIVTQIENVRQILVSEQSIMENNQLQTDTKNIPMLVDE